MKNHANNNLFMQKIMDLKLKLILERLAVVYSITSNCLLVIDLQTLSMFPMVLEKERLSEGASKSSRCTKVLRETCDGRVNRVFTGFLVACLWLVRLRLQSQWMQLPASDPQTAKFKQRQLLERNPPKETWWCRHVHAKAMAS